MGEECGVGRDEPGKGRWDSIGKAFVPCKEFGSNMPLLWALLFCTSVCSVYLYSYFEVSSSSVHLSVHPSISKYLLCLVNLCQGSPTTFISIIWHSVASNLLRAGKLNF